MTMNARPRFAAALTPLLVISALAVAGCSDEDDGTPSEASAGGADSGTASGGAGAGGAASGGADSGSGSGGNGGGGGTGGRLSGTGGTTPNDASVDGEVDDASVDGASDASTAPDAPGAPDAGPCGVGDPTGDPRTCSDTFTITVTCVAGPCAQQSYVHTYDVTWNGYAFSGTGRATEGATTYQETICGAVLSGQFSYHSIYTTVVPGYVIDGSGALSSAGIATGTGTGFDPRGATQAFTMVTSAINAGCAK